MTQQSTDSRSFNRLTGSYSFAMKWSRLTAAGFGLLAAIFGFWAAPWMGVGMQPQDYNGKVLFTLLLLIACFALFFLSVLLRSTAGKRKQALVAWTSVFDEVTGLHNRRFFSDRLALECEHGPERSGFVVALFAFETVERGSSNRRPPRPEVLRAAGHLLTRETRSSDVVAVMGRTELAVLATPLDLPSARRLLARIERVMAAELGGIQRGEHEGRLSVRAGLAVYGRDGEEPLQLLRAGRENLRPLDLPLPGERRSA